MSEGGSSSNGSSSSNAQPGSIGSFHTQTNPSGRLASVRGGRTPAAPSATPGGASKLKFAPTIPVKRNKKDASLSLLEQSKAAAASESRSTRGGRGERGRGGGGRGRGRPQFEMVATASGPFSLGPAQSARSRQILTGSGASGAHSSYTGVQAVKVEHDNNLSGEDRAFYGDAAVDLKFGTTTTDASAPTGLESEELMNKEKKLKEQEMEKKPKDGIKTFEGTQEDPQPEVDEAEEALTRRKGAGPAQDIMEVKIQRDPYTGHETELDKMFFFQFPGVMPAFKPRPVASIPLNSSVSSSSASSPGASLYSNDTDDSLLEVKPEPMDNDRPILIPDNEPLTPVKTEPNDRMGPPPGQRNRSRVVSAGVPGAPKSDATEIATELQEEGKIGRLLVYKSGKVKMKIGDIIMDVSSGSECSFLQDIVAIDSGSKEAFLLGSVQKRMICVPNLTQLLDGLEASDD
ncbi:hypothetical protein BGZ83_006791 [Gryganskiella cystojenkinii]|nr:hypothetical protein BGZ83_006791 [Gryganskiella cystojenkinii]